MKQLVRFLLFGLAAVSTVSVHAGPQHPWAMYRSDMARTGQSLSQGPDLGVVDWRYFTNGTVPTISVANTGKVFLGVTFHTEEWSNEEYFTVLNADGTVNWRLKVRPYDWGGAQSVFSGPALDSAGNVVINSPYGQVRKYDPAGTLLWTIQRRSNATNNSTPAIDQNDNVFHYQVIDGLRKYNPASGQIWSAGVGSQTSVAVFTNGDSCLGGVRTNEPHGSVNITYINADGTIRWQHTSASGTNGQVIFGPDNTVYQGSGAYNPDGTVKWGSPSGGSNTALGKNGQYYVGFAGSASTIRAYNAQTGAVLWDRNLPPVGGVWPPAIDSRDRVYVTTTDGYLFVLAPSDGAILLQTRLADSFFNGPVIGANNRLYVSGARFGVHYVYCIR